MISSLRHLFVDSWLGRILALLIFVAFIGWGAGDILFPQRSDSTLVANIGPRRITTQDLETEVRNELARVAQMNGYQSPSQISASQRRLAEQEALRRLVLQGEILAFASLHHINPPDKSVREAIFAMSFLQNKDGKFDRAILNERLRSVNMTESHFIGEVRDNLTLNGIVDAISANVVVPQVFVDRLVDSQTDLRIADIAKFSAESLPEPPPPMPDDLEHFYANNVWRFQTPEFRHVKVVVLTPDTIAKSLDIPDSELKAIYEMRSDSFHLPETRDISVITFHDLKSAQGVAAFWKQDSDWDAVRSKASGATSVTLPHVRQSEIPSAALASAVFATAADRVSAPLKTEAGWVLFRVSKIYPPKIIPFSQAKIALHTDFARLRAEQLYPARLTQFEDAVASSVDLERIPSNIGALPASGFINANGQTRKGTPVPIAGDDTLRQFITKTIFQQARNQPPHVFNGPGNSAFALVVDQIEPGHTEKFTQVMPEVRRAWVADKRQHAANKRATALFVAAKSKGGLSKTSVVNTFGAKMTYDEAVSPMNVNALPAELTKEIFSAKVGDTRMLKVGDDVYVFTLSSRKHAEDASRMLWAKTLKTRLESSMRDDIVAAFTQGLEGQIKPKLNPALIKRVFGAQDNGS